MTARAEERTTLAILAGGKGTRLGGVPKGLLTLGGVTLLERILTLRPLFEDVLLIANDPAPYSHANLTTCPDVIPDRGAPGGAYTALVHARTEWVLAVACDQAFVTGPVVSRLLDERSKEVDAVCFEAAGTLQPLPGLFRKTLAQRWEPLLASKQTQKHPSFRELLAGARTEVLPEGALRAVDPSLRSVESANTPEDLARLGVERPDDRR